MTYLCTQTASFRYPRIDGGNVCWLQSQMQQGHSGQRRKLGKAVHSATAASTGATCYRAAVQYSGQHDTEVCDTDSHIQTQEPEGHKGQVNRKEARESFLKLILVYCTKGCSLAARQPGPS